jgi:hypothetical protein
MLRQSKFFLRVGILALLIASSVFTARAYFHTPVWKGSWAVNSRELSVQVPGMISYQGLLTDKDTGQPMVGPVSLTFSLYTSPSISTPIWSETHPSVSLNKGLFQVLLGSISTMTLDLFNGDSYIGIRIGSGDELLPRQKVVSVAYAFLSERANDADTLDLMDSSAFASSTALAALESRVAALEDQLIDYDGDSFFAGIQDCNDANPAIHPGTEENCTDGVDNDCNTQVDCADASCSPDADADGYNPPPCGGDCNDSDPEVQPGQDDFPDMQGLDANCDGIDGEINKGIFVSTGGNDANDGSRQNPKLTIQAGINAAVALGKRDVYVASGAYTGQVNLASGVGVYGGYSLDFSTREPLANEVSLVPPQPLAGNPGTVNCINLNGGAPESTVLDGFSVVGSSQLASGASSYAVYIRGCDATLRISHNRILAGRGGDGIAGADGTDGLSGPSGTGGVNALDLYVAYGISGHNCQPYHCPSGGVGGARTCGSVVTNGGNGGKRVCPTFDGSTTGPPGPNGTAGLNGGGSGGSSGRDYYQNLSCYAQTFGVTLGIPGASGQNGLPGLPGAGCNNPAGQATGGLWQPGSATSGGAASHGSGGGGGGSGAGAYVETVCFATYRSDNLGGTGGGGGAGGCGGSGGISGGGGGGAFGVFVVFDLPPGSVPAIQENRIFGGAGGDGGQGGQGGDAGAGGLGGLGGLGGGWSSTPEWPSDPGGNGGNGGRGGYGGGGGGGCGGLSYAIYVFGQGSTDLNAWKVNNLLFPGASGGRGRGGFSPDSTGVDGLPGVAAVANF